MQPLCIKRRAFGDEDYLAIRNEGIDIVRNEGGLIGANIADAHPYGTRLIGAWLLAIKRASNGMTTWGDAIEQPYRNARPDISLFLY